MIIAVSIIVNVVLSLLYCLLLVIVTNNAVVPGLIK